MIPRFFCLMPTDGDREALARAGIEAAALADDGTDYSGRVVRKPWGAERETFRCAQLSVWRLRLDAKSETSMHCHPNKTTVLIVEEGSVILSTLQDRIALRQNDVVLLKPGTFHRTATEQPATLTEIEWPPNKRDLVRIGDRYGREGKGYEGAGR